MSLSVKELKAECKRRGLKGYSKLKKADLIALCSASSSSSSTARWYALQSLPSREDMTPYHLTHNLLGKGSYGEVREACKQEDCRYVAKISKLKYEDNEQGFNLEVDIIKRLQGVGPRLYDAFVYKQRFGVIIIEKLQEIPQAKFSDHTFMLKLMKKIDLMHDENILHGDLFGKNLMMDEKEEPVIIDFGISIPLQNITPVLRACDFVTLLYGSLHTQNKQDWRKFNRLPLSSQEILPWRKFLNDKFGENIVHTAYQYKIEAGKERDPLCGAFYTAVFKAMDPEFLKTQFDFIDQRLTVWIDRCSDKDVYNKLIKIYL